MTLPNGQATRNPSVGPFLADIRKRLQEAMDVVESSSENILCCPVKNADEVTTNYPNTRQALEFIETGDDDMCSCAKQHSWCVFLSDWTVHRNAERISPTNQRRTHSIIHWCIDLPHPHPQPSSWYIYFSFVIWNILSLTMKTFEHVSHSAGRLWLLSTFLCRSSKYSSNKWKMYVTARQGFALAKLFLPCIDV